MSRLDGKTVVVTGAGSGIGKASAKAFAAESARVLVFDLDADTAAATAAEITDAGGRARAIGGDVAKSADVDRAVEEAVSEFGRLDVFMNNAACPLGAPIAETDDELWRRVHSVTLDGVFYGTRAALRVMVPAGSGAIINVTSGAGLAAEPGLGAYGAAKAAVINLTKTAAVEYAAAGVRVNAISPGVIETPPLLAWTDQMPGGLEGFVAQLPNRRMGRPEEIAAVAVFLASDEASYVNGSVLVVDGGVAARLASPKPA